MNQEVAMWLGGFLILGAYGLAGAAFKLALSAYRHIADKTESHSDRIIRLETFAEIQGRDLARRLHSPHSPVLDRLLEKYYDRHYELSTKEWQELLEECQKAIKDNEGDEKADFAEFLVGVCHHKLMHDPPKRESSIK